MYKEELALNNLQWLICHKTQPNYDNNLWLYRSFVKETVLCLIFVIYFAFSKNFDNFVNLIILLIFCASK